jgi:hypothetical protein
MENWLLDILHFFKINTTEYPPIQVLFLGFGFIFWAAAYKEILWGIRQFQIVEVPMVVAAMDLSWEFCWGFLLQNDFSPLFKWGCIVWFFMNLFINYHTLQYGRKLVTNPWIRQNYVAIYLFILIGSGFITYFMKVLAEDDGLGLVSAFLINMVISASYIYQLLNYPEYRERGFRYRVAWTKFLGTGAISVACFMHFPGNYFLHTMCVMVFVMDVVYIYLYKNYQPQPA